MTNDRDKDQEKGDEVLRRLLKTPPKLHDPKKESARKAKPEQGTRGLRKKER